MVNNQAGGNLVDKQNDKTEDNEEGLLDLPKPENQRRPF